jgi:hypothetical protein
VKHVVRRVVERRLRITQNTRLLLATPPTVTTTGPVMAPLGTTTLIAVPLQLVTVARVPLNVTVLVPCVEPKPDPLTSTVWPIVPELGLMELIVAPLGGWTTVNVTPLLLCPPTPRSVRLRVVARTEERELAVCPYQITTTHSVVAAGRSRSERTRPSTLQVDPVL